MTHDLSPAHLWLGNHELLAERVTSYLQQRLCHEKGCGVCVSCHQLRQQQHHAVIWICPEKSYTLSTIQIIHEQLAFALPDDQELFFILQKADSLTTQCANALLKSIEEPPRGYHFILCAQRAEYVLPTIASRCVTTSFLHEQPEQGYHQLLTFFQSTAPADPIAFDKELQKNTPSEQQSLELIDALLLYWAKKYNQAVAAQSDTTCAARALDICKEALKRPPMPGSSKLFWRNIFLAFHA